MVRRVRRRSQGEQAVSGREERRQPTEVTTHTSVPRLTLDANLRKKKKKKTESS